MASASFQMVSHCSILSLAQDVSTHWGSAPSVSSLSPNGWPCILAPSWATHSICPSMTTPSMWLPPLPATGIGWPIITMRRTAVGGTHIHMISVGYCIRTTLAPSIGAMPIAYSMWRHGPKRFGSWSPAGSLCSTSATIYAKARCSRSLTGISTPWSGWGFDLINVSPFLLRVFGTGRTARPGWNMRPWQFFSWMGNDWRGC